MRSPAFIHKLWTVSKRCIKNPLVLLNYIGVLAAGRIKPAVMPFHPISIDVEPTGRCNFKCRFCQVPSMDRHVPDLTLGNFKKILAEFPYVLRVKIQGMGEPLLNNELFEIISYMKSRSIYTFFTTNGSLLTDTNSRKVLASGVDEIYISLDGATRETFESIRTGGVFEQVTGNIRRLASMRSKGRPLLNAWTVATRTNAGELMNIIRLAGELGLDGIIIQQDISFWGKPEFRSRYHDESVTQGDMDNILDNARALAEELGIGFSLHRSDSYSASSQCMWPWKSTYVSADGYIIPCCVRADPQLLNFGNILETPFRKIWNGPEYRNLRKSIKSNKVWDYCKDCYSKDS